MSGESLEGTVDRIIYHSEETGYSVLRLAPSEQLPRANLTPDGLVAVVGNLFEVVPGESLRLQGVWTDHPRHGRQFRVERCQRLRPATLEGIRRYIGSGLVKGIGPVTASRIVDTFGKDTLEVIDENPERLREVPGVGPKRAHIIQAAWEEQRTIRNVMVFLQGHGVSTRLAVKIYKTYGDDAVAVVEQDPYRMTRDIRGVGFLTADRIAQALGLARDAPSRLEAGVLHTLEKAVGEGHVFLPGTQLVRSAAELLEVSSKAVKAAIDRLLIDGTCVAGAYKPEGKPAETGIYLAPMYYAEEGVASRLGNLLEEPTSRLSALRRLDFVELFASGELALSDLQLKAVENAIRHKVSILTGGPGTGKTTALRALVDVLGRGRHSIALAAPTGRAAKRLSQATSHPARTIHRLLGFKPSGGFERDEHNPLNEDIVVIDEASMLDIVLANNLLKALDPGAHLMLVGDVDQLPSVGPGEVLRDIIASGVAPVTRLDTIFRQPEGSLIVRNAHRVNAGQMPLTPKGAADFFLFVEEDPGKAAALVVELVTRRIPRKFRMDSLEDVQVLSPMYRSAVGVDELNAALQEALNPPSPHATEKRVGGRVFRVGDKVMQTRNNYRKDVYNGDIGRIVAIRSMKQEFDVRFDDDRLVGYDFAELDELVHGYCVTVHKSQGSEYPCIVMPILTTHYVMLQRNLLYTAIARARRLVVLVGTHKAIWLAVKNDRVARRYTGLISRLRESF